MTLLLQYKELKKMINDIFLEKNLRSRNNKLPAGNRHVLNNNEMILILMSSTRKCKTRAC